ncbi:MAG: C4-dicarboxylate ABC transporter, partial [Rhodobacterales bacterium]|nr:C4-dicarboxylate ABC transporter [Rhodobacterales bacterium]
MKFLTATITALSLTVSANVVSAACDAGETVIKFAHVTNTDRH